MSRSTRGFTLIELMVVVAIIGVLAAVAIPAFTKNARKAKTSEATMNIKKLYDGARSYYYDEVTARAQVQPIAKQFPRTPSTSMQPAAGACCAGSTSKCAPNPALWTDPSWQALKFQMGDPHYYSYAYTSAGAGTASTFVATANGDLNCNFTYSTFEMVGSVTSDGSVTGQAGIFKDRELE